MITELRQEHRLADLMVAGAIARSTYYYWSRVDEVPDLYARAKELIKEIFHQH